MKIPSLAAATIVVSTSAGATTAYQNVDVSVAGRYREGVSIAVTVERAKLPESFVEIEPGHDMDWPDSSPTLRPQHDRWDREAESRFDNLVDKDVFGDLTGSEQEELEELQSVRFDRLAPRTYLDCKREFELDMIADEAMMAMNRLLEFVAREYNVTVAEN